MTLACRSNHRLKTLFVSVAVALASSACSDNQKSSSVAEDSPTVVGANIERIDIAGTPRADILEGTSSDERFLGKGGSDLLTGNGGRDAFVGGLGNDVLVGGIEDDIYYYDTGDRADIIRDKGGKADQIVFGSEISFDQVVFTDRPELLHLMIRDVPAQDSISILDWGKADNFIETMVFEGRRYSHSEVEAAIFGNRRPKLVQPIKSQIAKVGELFEFEIPKTSFVDPDDDDLDFRVMDHNRSWLPSWLSQYEDRFGVFGTPTQADIEEFVLRITVVDPGYRNATVLVSVRVDP